MKNLIVQYYIDVQKYSDPSFNNLEPSPIETYSSYSFQKYCKKFDIDYHKITEPKLHFKHPTWERFDLWTDRSWWQKYDQILYVDSDVMAFDHAPNIFELYPSMEIALKSPSYHKFRNRSPNTALSLIENNPYKEQYKPDDVVRKFIQPGVFMLNQATADFMLPWIEKYKEVNNPKIDDGMFLNHCIVKSKVPVLDMDKRFNHKNNGQNFDYNSIYFLHCAGGKKHKKETKIWQKLKKIFPEVVVDLDVLLK